MILHLTDDEEGSYKQICPPAPNFIGIIFRYVRSGGSKYVGGVVAFIVIQVYGSLALEDNSEVCGAVLGKCT